MPTVKPSRASKPLPTRLSRNRPTAESPATAPPKTPQRRTRAVQPPAAAPVRQQARLAPNPSKRPRTKRISITLGGRPNWRLEHLRDQLAKDKPALLDRLGWTKEDARRFIDRWEEMKRLAAEAGPQGDAARKELNDALRSLGLRPRGTELRHGGVAADKPENQRDARNSAPPPDWDEQMRAYTRGVAGADRQEKK